MSVLSDRRRLLVATGLLLLTALAGVLLGRAIRGDDTSVAEPPATSAPEGEVAADTRVIVTDAGELIAVATADYDAVIAELGLGDSGTDGRFDAADLRDPMESLIPVIRPVYVGGITDDEVSDTGDELLGRPIDGGEVGAAGGLKPVLATGARPSLGSIPVEVIEAVTEPVDTTVVTTSVTAPPTTLPPEASPATTTSPSESETTSPPATTTAPSESETTSPATTTAPSESETSDPASSTPPSGTVATIDLPGGIGGLPGFDPFGELPDPMIDPCAGIRPGDEVPEECPPGTGATLLGLGSPPDPFLFWSRGHYIEAAGTELTCPADTPAPTGDQVAMSLYSWTPLDTVTVGIRPYGSSVEWQDVTTLSSSTEHRAAWMENFAVRELDAGWAIVPHCLVLDRDPSVSYAIRAVGVDSFGRLVESVVGLVGADDPDLRPPSGGLVLPSGPSARAHAWTVADGVVRFGSKIVDPDDPADLDCTGLDMKDPIAGSPAQPIPVGLYDPDFRRRAQIDVPMPVAGATVVCAFIYESSNTVRNPIAVDRLLFEAPAGERPRLVLQGVRRFGDETIHRLSVGAGEHLGGLWDPCGTFVQLDELAPDVNVSVEETIYECTTESLLRTDADGRMTIPVVLNRIYEGPGSDFERVEMAIEVDVADCSREPCGDRPREWYEIPIPTRNRILRGTGFGNEGYEPGDTAAGIAVLRLEYERVGDPGPRNGAVTLLDQREITERSPFDELIIPNMEIDLLTGSDPFVRSVRVRFDTDRPIRGGLRIDPLASLNPSECLPNGPTIEPTTELRDQFEFEVPGLCAGHTYRFLVVGTDEGGTEWEVEPYRGSWFSVPSPSNRMTATVELLGGPARLGFLYRLGVQVERQEVTAYWLDLETPARGSLESCVALDGSVARSRGYWPPTYFGPDELEVRVYAHITTVGDDDCSGRSAGIDPIELIGTFTIDEIRDGSTLVVETPPDSPIQLRATIEQDGAWRPG